MIRGKFVSEPVRVLFLCTGNSCRSQIAEGWTRQLGGKQVEVQSAGIEAHGKNPRAIAIMQEAGIDISAQQSTVVDNSMLEWSDVVVTVCGHADEQCPVLPSSVRKLHWPLADPAKAEGNDEQITDVFRACRDEVKERVRSLLAELIEGDHR